MKLHRNTIYKMIHHSLINNPEEWVIDNDSNITLLSNGYHVENKKNGVKAWIAKLNYGNTL